MFIRRFINNITDRMIEGYECRKNGTMTVYTPPKPPIVKRLLEKAKKANPMIAMCCIIAAIFASAVIGMGVKINQLSNELEKRIVETPQGVMMYVADGKYTVVTPSDFSAGNSTADTAASSTTTLVTTEQTSATAPTSTTTSTTEATITTATTTTTQAAATATTAPSEAPVQKAKPDAGSEKKDNGKPSAGKTYNVSMEICRFIAEYEGRKKNEPYKCESQCWTIGYGHAYTSQESRKWSREHALREFNNDIRNTIGEQYCITDSHPRLSNEEAMLLLQWDLNHGEYKKKLDQFITKNKLILTQQQYDSLISFAYNNGANVWTTKKFKFRDTLVSYKNGDKIPPSVVRDQMDNWCHGGGGKVLNGLVRRRRNEARLFSTGSYKILSNANDY